MNEEEIHEERERLRSFQSTMKDIAEILTISTDIEDMVADASTDNNVDTAEAFLLVGDDLLTECVKAQFKLDRLIVKLTGE